MELSTLFIEPTSKTPQVDLNPITGELILSGRSIPENASKTYENILNWVTEYAKRPKYTTNLRFNLEYFNTSSSIWLAKIVRALCNIESNEFTLMIHLYFAIDEFDNMDVEDIKDELHPIIHMDLLARRALEICHFDPDTLEDKGAKTCGKACYECLLDYFNQPDHKDLNRYLLRDLLSDLSRSVCRPAGGAGSRAERMVALRKRCDSQLEKRWLDLIDSLLLRPPSDAQFLIESCSTQPDFFYREHNAAIYVDGPPHDEPDQIRADEDITRRLMEVGYIVIRFHHKADWKEILRQHPDIFGAVPA